MVFYSGIVHLGTVTARVDTVVLTKALQKKASQTEVPENKKPRLKDCLLDVRP